MSEIEDDSMHGSHQGSLPSIREPSVTTLCGEAAHALGIDRLQSNLSNSLASFYD